MSLFEQLYTYRQKEGRNDRENFLTELLAAMLRTYPQLLAIFLARIGLGHTIADCKIEVKTQVGYPEGRPDIIITSDSGNLLVLVECKLESEEGDNQLLRYEEIIKRCEPAYHAVVFLTKYYEPPRPGSAKHLRWHDLYSMSQQIADGGDLLAGFQDYLKLHNLHHPMTFLLTDLIALENIQAATRKMDEVLTPIAPLVRALVGGYYQNSVSRNQLHNGWYVLSGKLFGANLEVGFWSHQGGTVCCYCLVDGGSQDAGSNGVFEAIRLAWNLPHDTPLNYLECSEPMLRFITGGEDGADTVAMRSWFEARLQELAQAVSQATAGNTANV